MNKHFFQLSLKHISFLLLSFTLLASCTAQLANQLDENQANEILLVLEQSGIAATKNSISSTLENASQFSISVSKNQINDALTILKSHGLPKKTKDGFHSLIHNESWIPSPQKQKIKIISALNNELSSSIEQISGVIKANVHISFQVHPSKTSLASLQQPNENENKNKASVVIHFNPEKQKAFSSEQIKMLVSGAINGLSPSDVHVIEIAHTPTSPGKLSYTKVGPFLVSPHSATSLKTLLGITLGINLLFGGLIFWLWRRKTE